MNYDNLKNLPIDKIKYMLGIARAGVEHEKWGSNPDIVEAIRKMEGELKRRATPGGCRAR